MINQDKIHFIQQALDMDSVYVDRVVTDPNGCLSLTQEYFDNMTIKEFRESEFVIRVRASKYGE